jgi:predicted N-acetyltransferase YhbS
VNPKHQKRGVGSALVVECIRIADEESLPIFLNSFVVAYDLHLRIGFEDLEHFDFDLNEVRKKYRGYGIYR